MPNPRAVKEISIHASARRATIGRYSDRLKRLISIHASARRATNVSLPSWRGGNFYPRSARRATSIQNGRLGRSGISIHASARRATLPAAAIRSVIDDFYPRLREEGDGPIRVGNLSDIEISIHASARRATFRTEM